MVNINIDEVKRPTSKKKRPKKYCYKTTTHSLIVSTSPNPSEPQNQSSHVQKTPQIIYIYYIYTVYIIILSITYYPSYNPSYIISYIIISYPSISHPPGLHLQQRMKAIQGYLGPTKVRQGLSCQRITTNSQFQLIGPVPKPALPQLVSL